MAQKKFTEAEPLLLKIKSEKKDGNFDPEFVASALIVMADTYYKNKEYLSSIRLYKRAKEIAIRPDNSQLIFYGLGVNYIALNQFKEAEQNLKLSLAIAEKAGPKNSIGSSYNLADCYRLQRKFVDAEQLYKKTIELGEKFQIPASDLANVTRANALLYIDLGQYSKAAELCEKSIAYATKDPSNADLCEGLLCLSLVYKLQNKYEIAKSSIRKAEALCESSLAPSKLRKARCLRFLAVIYQLEGKYTEAITAISSSLKINESLAGKESLEVAIDLETLASYLQETKQFAKATPLFKRALLINTKVYGAGHFMSANDLRLIADNYHFDGNSREAEKYYKLALDDFAKLEPSATGDDLYLRTLDSYIVLLKKLNRQREASTMQITASELSTRFKVLNSSQ